MTKEEIKKQVFDWYSEEDKYFDESFETVMNTTHVKRKLVQRTFEIERDKLFGVIDNVVPFLMSLKEKGYVSIEERWSGYENNYFVAVKNGIENDEEYCERLAKMVNTVSKQIEEREKKKGEKEKRIKELEFELRKLKET